jgi:ribosomal protein L37AE/L43A
MILKTLWSKFLRWVRWNMLFRFNRNVCPECGGTLRKFVFYDAFSCEKCQWNLSPLDWIRTRHGLWIKLPERKPK